MPFDICTYRAEELPADALEAVAILTADAYERDLLADAVGDDPSTTPAAVHARLLRAFRQVPAGQLISVVWAIGRDGERVVVATARISHSDRTVPVGATVGDATSPLPTHATWGGFAYPTLPGLFAPTLPEAAVGEFTQFAAANLPWLAPHVARGVITAAEADAATRGAAFAAIAALYERDQESPAPPRGYVFATRALQVGVLKNRFGLHIVPLFGDGVELRPDILADPLHARTHRRWLDALAPHAPPDVIACGLRATIRHLVGEGFTRWSRIPMRLPWLLLNDAQTAAGMRRLAGVLPSALREPKPLVAAD
jgi:hypothetical protein